VLALIAPKIASAVANGMKFAQAKAQAGVDGLTGLPNAGALAAELGELKAPCAVIVCDLDGFKRVTSPETACLKRLPRASGDVAGNAISSPAWEAMNSCCCSAGRRITGTGELDGSFGVAFFPSEGSTGEELLAAADRRMYEHKGARHAAFAQHRLHDFTTG
jgi:GGDEF domain-containing protein